MRLGHNCVCIHRHRSNRRKVRCQNRIQGCDFGCGLGVNVDDESSGCLGSAQICPLGGDGHYVCCFSNSEPGSHVKRRSHYHGSRVCCFSNSELGSQVTRRSHHHGSRSCLPALDLPSLSRSVLYDVSKERRYFIKLLTAGPTHADGSLFPFSCDQNQKSNRALSDLRTVLKDVRCTRRCCQSTRLTGYLSFRSRQRSVGR